MDISDPKDEVSFKRGRPPVRNWDLWLVEDRVVTLYEGTDFDCDASSIRQQAYKKAEQRGGIVKATIIRNIGGKAAVKLFFTKQTKSQRVPGATLPPREETDHLTDESIDELFYRIHPELREPADDEPPLQPDSRLRLPNFTEDGDMEIDVPARQNPIDDPSLRTTKWGPPA